MNHTKQGQTKGKTILLVDDDADYLLEKRLLLQEDGYTVIEADSGKRALEIIETTKPDLVVADLMMEDEDTGFMVCYAVKKKYPNVPVIMVSGVAAEAGIEFEAVTREERSWLKADKLLAKPIRFEQLQREIEKFLGITV